MNAVARSVSGVGYIARVRLGHRLSGEGASQKENEAPEARAGLEGMLGDVGGIRAEIERKR